MRGTRWLILLAIFAILGGVGLTYRLQKSALEREAPARPKALPEDLSSSARDWTWRQSAGGESAVEIRAKSYGQSKDNSRIELAHVELDLYHNEQGTFDRVKSAKAQFSTEDKKLYSEGEVEITLGLKPEGQPAGRLVAIRSSGVTYDSVTGKAWTERAADFTFENGKGKSVGASYDPVAKELRMLSQVHLEWQAPGPGGKLTRIEAGDLTYKEAESKIWLLPWAKLEREQTSIESGPAVVTLAEGAIRKVETVKARGTDRYPNRTLEYSAGELWADFSETGAVTKLIAHSGANLISTAGNSATSVTATRVDMDFTEAGDESVLTQAVATGSAVVEAKPLPAERQPAETRILRSETVQMTMRPGGREIAEVETHAPGTLEFLPNRAGQRRRTLAGDRMWISYGEQNRIRSFRSVNVETRTEPNAEERKRNRAVAVTRSKNLTADFDPKTGQLAKMEQWDAFQYEEGERKATAERASLDQAADVVVLDAKARMWDATGSTAADRIRLDQRNGNFTATGHVNSSRLPDQKKPGSEMLAGNQPLQAIAANMTSTNRNRLVVYEGGVVLWQGANRIQGDRVEIDREKRTLAAAGNVTTQFLDEAAPAKGKAGAPAAAGAPVFTVVRAAKMVYTEADRVARYTGGAAMTRPGLDVKAAEIRAMLAPQGAESRIERAYADGNVTIARVSGACTATGTGEHGEYYAGEQKLVMRGGEPQLTDSCKGNVRGSELTYFANDDRLLVNGAPERPAKSRIRRK